MHTIAFVSTLALSILKVERAPESSSGGINSLVVV